MELGLGLGWGLVSGKVSVVRARARVAEPLRAHPRVRIVQLDARPARGQLELPRDRRARGSALPLAHALHVQ